jgi:hypothetical protein
MHHSSRGGEADHPPLTNAMVKNDSSYMPVPSVCLHGIERDKFTFCLCFAVLHAPYYISSSSLSRQLYPRHVLCKVKLCYSKIIS